MSPQKVIVFASFTPLEDKVDQVIDILRGMRSATRRESGNEVYDLYRAEGPEGKVKLHIFEVYADQAGLAEHRDSGHYKAYRAEIPELLEESINVIVLSAID